MSGDGRDAAIARYDARLVRECSVLPEVILDAVLAKAERRKQLKTEGMKGSATEREKRERLLELLRKGA